MPVAQARKVKTNEALGKNKIHKKRKKALLSCQKRVSYCIEKPLWLVNDLSDFTVR